MLEISELSLKPEPFKSFDADVNFKKVIRAKWHRDGINDIVTTWNTSKVEKVATRVINTSKHLDVTPSPVSTSSLGEVYRPTTEKSMVPIHLIQVDQKNFEDFMKRHQVPPNWRHGFQNKGAPLDEPKSQTSYQRGDETFTQFLANSDCKGKKQILELIYYENYQQEDFNRLNISQGRLNGSKNILYSLQMGAKLSIKEPKIKKKTLK